MAASRKPTMTNAKVKQNSKVTVDEFFKDFFSASVDLDGASAADNGLNSVSSQGDWLQVVNRARLTKLLKKRPENKKIFDWIERYVAETQKKHPEFIRVLVTIICRNSADGEGQSRYIDPEILKQRAPVLQRYIDNKRPLELHALYAVQAFDHSLHSPPGLLRILFGVLYDEDVCSEESFYGWKASKVPKDSYIYIEPIPSQENSGKEAAVVREPEAKVSKESAKSKEIVQDVTTSSEKPKETTQPEEDKRSTEKTDDAQSDVAKRKNVKESVVVVSEKQAEVAVVPDTTPAKHDGKEEKPDRYDTTEDRENVNEADNVESENSKNKEKKPNPKDNKMQLKYAYREDQWSPVNPEGKKRYDRDFLLQFQKVCTYKPDGLPNIPDIVLDRAVVQPLSLNVQQGGNQKNLDFMPHFMKSPRVQGGKQPNYPTGQGWRSSREPLKVIQRARDSVETKLLTSDKAWKPGYKRAPDETKSTTSSEDAKRIQVQLASKVAMVASDLPQSGLSKPHRVPPVQQPTPQTQTQTQTQPPQWSPVNPEGKKQYDRDFLLQYQKRCTDKPDGLPNIPDIILDKMAHRPFHQQSYQQVYQPTTPPYYSSPPQPVWLNPATQATPRQQFTSQPPAPRPDSQQQRRKTIIRIVDHVTNQDSTTSSEDAKRIQAQFASTVAMVASDLPQSLPKAPRPQHRVPSQSPRIPSPLVSPVAVNTHPHDMNKKGAPSQPAPIMNMGPVRFQAPRQALPRGYQMAHRPFHQQLYQQVYQPTTPPFYTAHLYNKGVDFTIDDASVADNYGLNSVSSQGYWLRVFNRGLTELLNKRPDNNKIFDWIEHNVAMTQKKNSEFIRALVTIICQNAIKGEGKSCRIDPEIFKQQCSVLQRYIDYKRPLELQAVYAAQALNHSLHSPPGLLRILFDVLYDEDIVSEESFYDWKANKDPKESAGKGVALKSVASFFTWLAEAD